MKGKIALSQKRAFPKINAIRVMKITQVFGCCSVKAGLFQSGLQYSLLGILLMITGDTGEIV